MSLRGASRLISSGRLERWNRAGDPRPCGPGFLTRASFEPRQRATPKGGHGAPAAPGTVSFNPVRSENLTVPRDFAKCLLQAGDAIVPDLEAADFILRPQPPVRPPFSGRSTGPFAVTIERTFSSVLFRTLMPRAS